MSVKSNPTYDRRETIKFDTDYLDGYTDESGSLYITTRDEYENYRDIYLEPWQVKSLSTILTKIARFYKDVDIDTSYPDFESDKD